MMTMGGGDRRTEAIMREIAALRAEREELDRRILFFESQLRVGDTAASPAMLPPPTNKLTNAVGLHAGAASLSSDVIRRYSGHLLLPDFGIQGTLGIVDGDDVELGNLHRQTMHVEAYVGQPKVKSAAAACRGYDIVVDATNSLPSRYMLSDCCVLLKKPLVSGSAFGLEGQVSVYNHNKSPCYRCLFPNPPASAPCQSHSDSGILGVGVIGCLQALEVIKVATGVGEPLCGRMLLFDALSSRFKTVKIHRRLSTNCTICGENATLNEEAFTTFDYDIFIQTSKSGKPTSLDPLPENARVTSREYKQLRDSGKPHLLLDVRPAHHFQIASIPNSLNIPLQELEERLPRLRDALNEVADSLRGKQRPLYFICRRGDDSQVAVRMLRENGFLYATAVNGGLESWVREVDPGFPAYW
ncbi:hypothetical protein PR202_ga03097 [Eleusine coracana subsp. coracana]|uniref:Rhodanese domain-containing protein n=1 Tax=Eleusine coracana subsp. coracana TaxID=191504 RepID=A0AAV5BN75_ELECO|nr:hypothetical protein PR202_ga03097 [Eleusine coracana subsp. coracana]